MTINKKYEIYKEIQHAFYVDDAKWWCKNN